MKKRSRLLLFPIILLILASLACSIQANLGGDATESAAANTEAAAEPLVEEPPTGENPVATEPPGAIGSTAPMVTGILVDTNAGEALSLYNSNFTMITDIMTPGGSGFASYDAAVIGSWDGGATPPRLAFRSFNNGGEIYVNESGSITLLTAADGFMAMVSGPATPVLAYSRLMWNTDPIASRLYFANIGALASGASLIQEFVDPNGWAVTPLTVITENDEARGVWYTMGAWGIGGDIVFRPVRSLRYYDALSGAITEILNDNQRPAGISWDGNWIAYSEGSYSDLTGLTLRNLASSFSVTLPLLATSDRGAGDAIFSPDGLHVAWMEGSGWFMAEVPNYHGTVRVASTSGEVLHEIPDTAVHGVIGDPSITWLEPVGWLSNTLLLLQARGNTSMAAYLVTFDITTGSTTYVLNGSFVSLVYQ